MVEEVNGVMKLDGACVEEEEGVVGSGGGWGVEWGKMRFRGCCM